MSKHDDSSLPLWLQRKHAVRSLDREKCTNCLRPLEEVETLDVDHCVPRGRGGSELLSNNSTLCRQCHDAKHGNGLAPTVEFASTGQMSDYEFRYFEQFWKEMLPALARQVDVVLEPKFGLADRDAIHMPVGDVIQLDQQLVDDPEYGPLSAFGFM